MSTMSNEEIIKVVQASIDGEVIEYRMHSEVTWRKCNNTHQPNWQFFDRDYRVKQLTLEEFIENYCKPLTARDDYNNGVHNACNAILNHMKKLQGDDHASRD